MKKKMRSKRNFKIIIILSSFVVIMVQTACASRDYAQDAGFRPSGSITNEIGNENSEHGKEETNNETEDSSSLDSTVGDDNKTNHEPPDSEEKESNIEEIEDVNTLVFRNAITASAGIRSCVFLMNDGKVNFFGDNYSGQENVSSWDKIISVSTLGYYVVGLNENGEVKVAGNAYDPVDTSNWKNIAAVSAGEQFVVALDSSGKVYASGHSADGQCDFNGRNNVKLIATGWRHTVIVDKEDNVEVAGFGAAKQNSQLEALKENNKNTKVVKVAAGGGYEKKSGHTVILYDDGSVKAVGNNSYGQCDVDSWTDIVDIAAGDWHTVGLKKDGTVVVTGDYGVLNPQEEPLSKWEDVVAVSAGRGYTIGLKVDGTVLFAGYDHDNGAQLASETSGIKIYKEWYVFNNDL